MKILGAEQIRKADQYTIIHEPIASIDLMERASHAFVRWFTEQYEEKLSISIVCGTGNNGGDGLAVARLLFEKGYHVEIVIIDPKSHGSEDFATNKKRLPTEISVKVIKSSEDLNSVRFANSSIIIDAIFGSGLNRNPVGIYAEAIDLMNDSDARVVSIDVPSGMFADSCSNNNTIVKADVTVSFQLPKLAFFLPENSQYVDQVKIVDIGLHEGFIESEPSNFELLVESELSKLLVKRKKFDHKGNYGHAIVFAGSKGKMGAAILATKAALRGGAGLVTAHVPQCGEEILQVSVPEAMLSLEKMEKVIGTVPDVSTYNAVAIGPGIGISAPVVTLMEKLLKNYANPVVVDADALNILSVHRHLLLRIPPNSILTPHPGEFRRLVGEWENDIQKIQLLQDFSKNHQVICVLKGANSMICSPEGKIYINTTGNPGMATGGSGDVLTGIITGLLAQNYDPLVVALLGVFLHGKSGDIASNMNGQEALIAGDIIENLGSAFLTLSGN